MKKTHRLKTLLFGEVKFVIQMDGDRRVHHFERHAALRKKSSIMDPATNAPPSRDSTMLRAVAGGKHLCWVSLPCTEISIPLPFSSCTWVLSIQQGEGLR